ncbi:hypothetical protein [Arthrobacter sp. ISL-65]|uniref:hypothetical protein n=1 Tax=Arthrobacter sp. ISL-65 TaxID=2819112 RepID=UPI001BE7333E|nr:hypothetical protein [Arthrobacter sp. ISL-65]MBT2549735.1 hypothetical protein [Arthrobacter sp. ISL-65]
MTADKVGAVGEKKIDEHLQRVLNRPFYYGYSAAGKTVYAYTKEEWGIGASSGGGDHNLIRSFYFSLLLTVLVALPASLIALAFGILLLFKMPVMALVMLFFGLVFGLGVVQGYFNITEEWRGRKARKRRDLPKPWWEASDDHAYEWFLKHPDPRIQMTLDCFPYSVKLRDAANTQPNKAG